MDPLLGKAADPQRKHPLYNTSPYTFARLLGDAENITQNLVAYINGFSPTARRIFERFKFADQIEYLDKKGRLFTVVKAMADVDLHPDRIDNLQMGYLFEHLVMRFNEQANEEAGDHFTLRQAKLGEGGRRCKGIDKLETFYATQQVRDLTGQGEPPAGIECCVVRGRPRLRSVHRERAGRVMEP